MATFTVPPLGLDRFFPRGAGMPDRSVSTWARWTNAVLLIAVTGGLVWAITAGDRESAAYWAMGEWLLLGTWVVPRSTPDSAAWALALIAVGCGAAAVGFFCLYRWAGWPVIAWVDAIIFGAFALQAVFSLWIKCLRLRPGPADAGGSGEQA
jgi:hypothetical protein